MRSARTVALVLLIAAATACDRTPGSDSATAENLEMLASANDNRTPSGSMRDGVLTLQLVSVYTMLLEFDEFTGVVERIATKGLPTPK